MTTPPEENDPTKFEITFTASGTVGQGTALNEGA